MLRRIWLAGIAVVLLMAAGPVWAGPVENGEEAYTRGRYAEALKLWETAAKNGNPRAQFWIGELYYFGQGVKQDYTTALGFLNRAAESGDGFALRRLGVMYGDGEGVERDPAKAGQYFKEALPKIRSAAEKGNAWAQINLGRCYQFGTGVIKNGTEAVRWYKKAGSQGNPDAQNRVGHLLMYSKGTDPYDVRKDEEEAVRWYKLAAEQGLKSAQHDLALAFFYGHGVKPDVAAALPLLQKAAEQGNDKSQLLLGRLHAEGVGVPRSKSEAVKWYLKAAEQGDAKVRQLVSWCFLTGWGVTKDQVVAKKWCDENLAEKKFHNEFGLYIWYAPFDFLKYMLSRKAPKARFHRYLSAAAAEGRLDIVKYMVEQGAEIDSTNVDHTPAQLAALNGHLEVLKYLSTKGANLGKPSGYIDKATALMLAAENGRDEVVKYLIAEGVDLNAKDYLGVNALGRAARTGQTKSVKLLLENGIDYEGFDLVDITGNRLRSVDYKGKVVVLLFTSGSGCGPCRESDAFVKELYGKYRKQDLVFIAIVAKTYGDTSVERFINVKLETPKTNRLDPNFDLVPGVVVLDREGTPDILSGSVAVCNWLESVLEKVTAGPASGQK